MIALVVGIYLSLLALNIWAILIRPARPWAEKVGMLLQIVGLYTFGFGVISQTHILPSDIASDLSSPDLLKFLAGNSAAASLGSAAMSMALSPEKTSFSAFAFLQLFGNVMLGAFVGAYFIFYAFVVAPLSYVAYVLVSLPVSAIMTAGQDFRFVMDGQTTSVREVVATNSVLIKNFLIAFSSLALKMSLEIVTSLRKSRRRTADGQQPDRPGWFTRHPRVSRSVLLGSQAILGTLVFVLVVGALSLPSLARGEANTRAPIGEIVGAEIVMALVIWAFMVLLLKAWRRRKMIGAPQPTVETVGPTA